MSKRSPGRRKSKEGLRGSRNPEATPKHASRLKKVIVYLIEIALGFLGILSVVTYLPRLTIDVGATLDSRNPLMTTFRISNDGYFSVSKLRYEFAMLHLTSPTSGNRPSLNLHGKNVFVTNSNTGIPVLRPSERASLFFPPGFAEMAQDVRQCEIEVVIWYRPFVWPITKEKRYRFEAIKDAGDKWQWTEKATSEKY